MNEEPFFQSDQITPADSTVEIIEFTAQPYEDHKRINVYFRLSYFQDPPNAAIALFGINGEKLASVDVVNIFQPENEITLHIPKVIPQQGDYQVELTLFKMEERKAQADEKGEVKITTRNLQTSRITFTLQ